MPPVLIPIFVALGASATAAAIYAGITELVILTLVSRLLTPSINARGTTLPTGQTQEYTGTVEPRRIVYGTNLISGLNVIPPWCHGTNNEMLDQVLVLAGHPCAALRDVYFNQEKCTLFQPITGTFSDGQISGTSYSNKIWARRYDGTQTTYDFILNAAWPSYWTTTHVGRGCAYIALQYLYDTTVFASGKPDVRVMVDGKKVYDPRLDTAPGANPGSPTATVFSTNPALCILDYLLDMNLGLGEAPTRMDWVSIVAAANVCDELVTIPGSITQKRYTCSCVLDVTDNYEDNLKVLAGAMQGAVLYSSGKWIFLPGKYQTSSFTITDDDLAGTMDLRTSTPYRDRYNAVRGQFYDPTALYAPLEYSPARVSSDETADGEVVWRELQQGTCTNAYEAQRNAMIEQRKSRRKKSFSLAANYSEYAIRPGDFGTISITELGITSLPVRCLGWKLDGKTMSLQLSFAEVASADWNDPAPSVYAVPGTVLGAAPATFVPGPTANLQAQGAAGGINLTWDLPGIWYNNLVVDLYESTANDWSSAVVVWSGVNTGVYIAVPDIATRYFWTKVRNLGGNVRSPLDPSGVTAGVAATPLTASVGPQGPPGDGGISGSLSIPIISLQANSAGHVSVYPALVGHYKVFLGTKDVTAQCTFMEAPNGNPDALSYTLNADGSYAVNGGMPDDVDQTIIVLRAVYVPP